MNKNFAIAAAIFLATSTWAMAAPRRVTPRVNRTVVVRDPAPVHLLDAKLTASRLEELMEHVASQRRTGPKNAYPREMSYDWKLSVHMPPLARNLSRKRMTTHLSLSVTPVNDGVRGSLSVLSPMRTRVAGKFGVLEISLRQGSQGGSWVKGTVVPYYTAGAFPGPLSHALVSHVETSPSLAIAGERLVATIERFVPFLRRVAELALRRIE